MTFGKKILPKEEIIPKFEDKYSYKLSRLGYVDEKIDESINHIYKDNRTILINEASNYGRSNYAQILVSLIKMGANTTLRDISGKTAIDYIPNEKLDEVYKNLKDTLKHWEIKTL